jgi:hypothetical protein
VVSEQERAKQMSGRIRILHVEYEGDSPAILETIGNLMSGFADPPSNEGAPAELPAVEPLAELPEPERAPAPPAKRRDRPATGRKERATKAGQPGSKWSAERLAKYRETWRKKMEAFDEANAQKSAKSNGRSAPDGKKEPAEQTSFRSPSSNGNGLNAEERARRHEAAKQRLNL